MEQSGHLKSESTSPKTPNEQNFGVGDSPLSAILATELLTLRPVRAPDYQLENAALVSLAETLARPKEDALQKLVDHARQLCEAHSAGLSVVDVEGAQPVFRWLAISGELAPFKNGIMPRFFSPCGEVLERATPLLLQHPIRHYPYIATLKIDIHEVLLVPFYQGPDIVGTVWVVAHDSSRIFDGEDLRRLESLCKFAATAVMSLQRIKNLQDTTRRLEDLQFRMETALTIGAMATWIWDVTANQLHADRNLKKMFGLDEDAVNTGNIETYLNLIHPDDRAMVLQKLNDSVQFMCSYDAEFRLQVPGEPLHWLSTRGKMLTDPAGQRRLLTGAVVDITERRQMEDQLRIKSEQLAEASKRKDEFLATLSHELRSPLNIIQGHAELLRLETPGTREFEESLDAIERSARLQTQLISDMLDVSRIITGKMLLDISVFNPREIVLDAVQAIQYAADARSLQLIHDIEEPCGMINGDRGRLQQALWNFLTNAVKFSPQGGKVIIQVRPCNGFIEFHVIDRGQGISSDFLPYVFDRFNQEDGSKSRKHGGLGLGLAIVRHIAELHGGSVRAASAGKNLGSTFTLSIPVVAVVDDFHTTFVTAQASEKQWTARSPSPLANMKILAVDDQPEASSLLERTLETLGAEVRTVCSAEQAWLQLERGRYDILISDIGMPELNGFDLIKTWRSRERELERKTMPAIALTAYGTAEDRMEIMTAGFTAHLPKPAGLSQLAETILHQVRRASEL